jgi:hypothetical protein
MGSKRYLSKLEAEVVTEGGDSPDFGTSTPLCTFVLADQVEAIASRTTRSLTFQAFDLAIDENRISLDTVIGDSRALPGFDLASRLVLTLILRHPTQLSWSHQQDEMTMADYASRDTIMVYQQPGQKYIKEEEELLTLVEGWVSVLDHARLTTCSRRPRPFRCGMVP